MTYRERRKAKADRLRGWAEKREVRAAAVFAAGEPFTSDYAFNTQPGHIPFRAKLIDRENRACESLNKADGMRSRAAGIDAAADRAIYSDDADAIPALEARILELEAKRAEIKARPHEAYELANLSGNISRQRKRLAILKASAASREP